ncbi:MAG: hypothetical protein WCS07_08595 [Sphaerochaeta sp.]
MKTEMQVLDRLAATIASQIANHFSEDDGGGDLGPVGEQNISIDFPDVDSMRKNTMFYIQPDYENLEDLSMSSDLATMHVTLFILCKGASSEKLVRRVFGYYTALYVLVRGNQTLDGFIDFARITDMDYYPAVTASATVTAMEISLQLQWSKDF